MLWFHNGFYILLTFILLVASAEPFPSFLFSSFAWISRFLWVSQKIKEFFRMPSVGVKDVDQQKFTVALAAFLKKSGKVSHLNFALLNRIFRQTYQTVMAAILRDVAAIGTVPGFQRRSRSSTEPILACWFLILMDYSMKSCRRNWDFEFVLASLRYSHLILYRSSCLNGWIWSRPTLPRSSLPTMRTGTTSDWLQWLDTSTWDLQSVSPLLARSMEVNWRYF